MKKCYFLPMLITVLFMLPVILVCQTPDIKLSHNSGEQSVYPLLAANNLFNGLLSSPSIEGAVSPRNFADINRYTVFGLYGNAGTTGKLPEAGDYVTICKDGTHTFSNLKILNKIFLSNLTMEELS